MEERPHYNSWFKKMSKIKVNNITNVDDNAAVSLDSGATIPSGANLTVLGNTSVTGVITATSFTGDGSALTNIGGDAAQFGKLFAFGLVVSFDTTFRS